MQTQNIDNKNLQNFFLKWKGFNKDLKTLFYILLVIVIDGFTGFYVMKFIFGTVFFLVCGFFKILPVLMFGLAKDIK
jgi:hypothetical protein